MTAWWSLHKPSVVEQVLGPKLAIDVDQHPLGGLTLAGVAGHGIAMIEIRMPGRIEFDATARAATCSWPSTSLKGEREVSRL